MSFIFFIFKFLNYKLKSKDKSLKLIIKSQIAASKIIKFI